MRIGDAAAAAGTTPRALRFYEQRGLLPPPRRTRTGQRLYGEQEVARVRVIRELLAHGLTVEDVAACADRLHLLEDDVLPRYGEGVCTRTSGVVERRIAALDAEIGRLTALRDRLGSVRGAQPAATVHSGASGPGDALHEQLQQSSTPVGSGRGGLPDPRGGADQVEQLP
ncbi:MerR family transcriptional regulator [Umezawaea sp. NPDC059074]|uniref:MerR family transcriptional regulator n=1 Tax=Umezawaea sp. NPDC059074 TaxID=3346716 RepID=UPI0036763C5E